MAKSREVKLYITGDAKSAQAALGKAGSAAGGFASTVDKLGGKLGGLPPQLQGVLNSIGGLGTGFAAGAAAGGLLIAALFKAAQATVSYASEVRQVQQVTGASAQSASKLVAVLDDYKVSAESAGKAFGIFSKKLEGGSLDKYLTSAEKAKIRSDGLGDSLPILAAKFQKLGSTTEQNTFLLEAFGRSGLQMREVLSQSGKALEQAAKQAEKLGLVLSQKDLDAARDFEFALDDLQDSLKGVELTVGRRVVPAFTGLFNAGIGAIDIFTKLMSASDRLGGVFGALAPVVGGVIGLLSGVGAGQAEAGKRIRENTEALEEQTAGFAAWQKRVEAASKEFDARLDQLVPKFGDTFAKVDAIAVSSLGKTFATNAQQVNQMTDLLTGLAAKIGNTDVGHAFLAHLQALGPGAVPLLQNLNTLSAAELGKLSQTFGGQIAAAKRAADLEFDKFPANFQQKLEAAKNSAVRELDKLAGQFAAMPAKTGPMADQIAAQMRALAIQIKTASDSGAVALTPIQRELLNTALKTRDPKAALEALQRFIDSMHGKRVELEVHRKKTGDWSDAHIGGGVWHAGGPVMHKGGPIPRFHTGAGPLARDEVPAILQRGEFVIRRSVVRALGSGFFDKLNAGQVPSLPGVGGGAPTINVYLTVQGSVTSERDLIDVVHAGLLQKERRGGSLGV